jgi:ATP-binding cassette subfamily F protein uup
VLDEPTNDLDAETLELLEVRLLEYSGTILLVSHDRTFLNNVVTSTIALEGEGRLREYVGGYDDWLRQNGKSDTLSHAAPKELKTKREKPPREKRKLSFNETRELEALPQKIEEMEKAKSELLELLNSPDFYKDHDHLRMTAVNTKLEELEVDLTLAYARWDELEELAASFGNRS